MKIKGVTLQPQRKSCIFCKNKTVVKWLWVYLSIWVTWIYVMVHVQPAGRPSWVAKTLTVGYYTQTFQAFQTTLFTFAMLIGTIDYYHFILLSLTLTFPGGHKANAKNDHLAVIFHTLFSWSGLDLMWRWRNSSGTFGCYDWVRFNKTRKITAVLLTAFKKTFDVGMHSDVYESM